MLDHSIGRAAKNEEQAESYILRFVAESVQKASRENRHHGEYDLYLPWLMEIVQCNRAPVTPEMLSIPELERLYMDVAWFLCLKGTLRPGPHSTASPNASDAVGKGFCLTKHGRRSLGFVDPFEHHIPHHAIAGLR